MYSIRFLSVWSLFGISSPMVLRDKLSVLLCKSQCKSYSGCKSVLFNRKDLRCELIFDTTLDRRKADSRLFRVQEELTVSGCSQKERVFHTRGGSLKCVKCVKGDSNMCKTLTEKEEPCGDTVRGKTTVEKPHCILMQRQNITLRPNVELVGLNMTLKPGMKLIVYSGSVRGAANSHFCISRDPENAQNPMKWITVNFNWNRRKVDFKQAFSITGYYNGEFPISDRYHFTMVYEITESNIKIYADKVPMKTVEPIPGLAEFNTHYISKIHDLVVQNTGEGCENVNNGIP